MRKRICFAVALFCVFVAGVLHADTGSLQLSLRDVITAYAISGTVTFNGPQQLAVPTDENGNLLVTLQTGDYIVQTSPQGYSPLTTHYNIGSGANLPMTIMLDSTSLPEDERTQQLTSELRPGFTLLHGYIVDSKTGKPIAGVRVQLVDAHVETETKPNGHYGLSVATPNELPPGMMGTDTLVFEKSGYDKVVIHNFGIGGEDLRLAPLGLQQGNGVMHRDGAHKLSDKSPYELQSASPAFELPASVYSQLVTTGKHFSVAGVYDVAGFPSINVPTSIRLGMGPGGASSLTYVPCASKTTCASVVAMNLDHELRRL